MEGLAGATLRVKLRHFEPWTEARRAIAAKYNDVLPASELIRTSDRPRARRPLSRLNNTRLTIDLSSNGLEEETATRHPVRVRLEPASWSLYMHRWLCRSLRGLQLKCSPFPSSVSGNDGQSDPAADASIDCPATAR